MLRSNSKQRSINSKWLTKWEDSTHRHAAFRYRYCDRLFVLVLLRQYDVGCTQLCTRRLVLRWHSVVPGNSVVKRTARAFRPSLSVMENTTAAMPATNSTAVSHSLTFRNSYCRCPRSMCTVQQDLCVRVGCVTVRLIFKFRSVCVTPALTLLQ